MAEQTNGVGHNVNGGLTEEQMEAVFHRNLGEVRRLRDRLASVNSDLRNAYKRAKADGFSKIELDWALRAEKDRDNNELSEAVRRQVMIAKWMRHPLGRQADMFGEDIPDREPLEDKVFADGKLAGYEGGQPKPPEGCANPDVWMKGWHYGQDVLKAALPLTAAGHAEVKASAPKGDASAAAPRRRGRPPGSGKRQQAAAAEQEANAAQGDAQENPETFAQTLGQQNAEVEKQLKNGSIGDQPPSHHVA